ncbi:ABC transporter permease [Nocardioides insulae]|uniref:ABC transporter permease n=1 Tax=Nocardioides insulae TaxID=394734 RepID=UPI0004136C22|nr:ABC transporter permease [Nocardioides insulae]
MLKLVGDRLLWLVPILLIVTMLTFCLLSLAQGDIAATILGDTATPEAVAQLNQELGLDHPVWVQYTDWLLSAVQGNFGTSLIDGSSVSDSLLARLPVTLSLTLGGLVVAVVLGLAGGVFAALRPGGWIDRLTTVLTSAAVALPSFWVGMLLSVWVGVNLGWFPAGGYVPLAQDPSAWALSLVLPSIALGLAPAAGVARQMRAALITSLDSEYARTARAKGVPRGLLIRRHALRNSLGPVSTILGFQAATMLGGSFVIEIIFQLPGLGGMMVPAVLNTDYPMILGAVTMIAIAVLLINMLVDVVYGYVDPRVRAL